jgi:hypothetical protein
MYKKGLNMKIDFKMSLVLSSLLLFSGCGSDDDDNETGTELETEMEHEHGDDERVLFFYNASTNDHFAYSVESSELINLNSEMHGEENISKFNISTDKSGKPFIWLDSKGDTNATNDEEKIVMFNNDFQFDRNATWEDFIYLGHFHSEEDGAHLAAHSNDEFNVAAGAKYFALNRLNTYISEQNELKNSFDEILTETDVCGLYTNIDLEENLINYYVVGTDGKLRIYDESKDFVDEVAITGSCTSENLGMSGVEGGVWIFLADTQKIYQVDSHDDGVFHIHTTSNVSEFVGEYDVEYFVSIKPNK